MGCACKSQNNITTYYSKMDKINGKKRDFKDWMSIAWAMSQSIFVNIVSALLVLLFCPFFILYIVGNIIIGNRNLKIVLPKSFKNYIEKYKEDIEYGESELPN